MLRLTLLFIFFILTLQSEEYVDINAQISLRTQQYSTGSYEKIIVSSPPRTGSTLVFNVLRFLFEDQAVFDQSTYNKKISNAKVEKTHTISYPKENQFVFIPIRNPIDACYSNYRIFHKDRHILEVLEEITEPYIQSLIFIESLNKYPNVVCIKYEDFLDNFDYLFDLIEKIFSITIHDYDKNLIAHALSKENVLANIQQYPSFNEYHPATHLHGEHIDLKVTPQKAQDRIKARIREKLKPYEEVLKKWGYGSFAL